MCHAPAECFKIDRRGYLDEGHWADVVVLDLNKNTTVTKENIHYKCGWSPLEGRKLKGRIETTIVSGNIVYHNGKFIEGTNGRRMTFH